MTDSETGKLTPRQKIEAAMQRHNLTVQALFIPWSQRRSATGGTKRPKVDDLKLN